MQQMVDRTMANRNWYVGLVALMAILFLVPAFASADYPSKAGRGGYDGNKHHGRGGHRSARLGLWRNPELIQALELTADQVKRLRDTDFGLREKALPLKAELARLGLQMDKLFTADDMDEKAILEVGEKVAGVRGQLGLLKLESRLALGRILNPDQLDKLKRLKRDKRRSEKARKQGQRRFHGCHHNLPYPAGYPQGAESDRSQEATQ